VVVVVLVDVVVSVAASSSPQAAGRSATARAVMAPKVRERLDMLGASQISPPVRQATL
jgi:hypothetical protein